LRGSAARSALDPEFQRTEILPLRPAVRPAAAVARRRTYVLYRGITRANAREKTAGGDEKYLLPACEFQRSLVRGPVREGPETDMVEMQGNCPHCGAELEAGAMFCAECGRPVARGGEATARPATADAAPAEPAKPQGLARTMMGVQASSLFGNRSPGTPPAATKPTTPAAGTTPAIAAPPATSAAPATPQGAFAPAGQGGPQIGPPPASFGAPFKEPPRSEASSGASAAADGGEAAAGVKLGGATNVSAADGGKLDEEEASATRARVAPTRPGVPLAGPQLAPSTSGAETAGGAEHDAAEPPEPEPAPLEVPLAQAPGAGAALGGKTLHGAEFGRDSGNVGAQLAAAVAAAKAAGSNPAPASSTHSAASTARPAANPPPTAAVEPAPAEPAAAKPLAAKPLAAKPLAATSTGNPPFGPMAGTPAEAVASERPRRALAKTMLGISPDAALGLARSAEAQAAEAAADSGDSANPAPVPEPAPRTNPNPMARTMLGMANPMAAMPAAGAAPGAPAGAPKSTIQGLPMPGRPDAGLPPVHGERGGMNRTMLGMAPLSAGASPLPPGPGPNPAAAGGGRTMLGVPHSEAGSAAAGAGPAAATDELPFDARATAQLNKSPIDSKRSTNPPPRREIKALWPLVATTLVVVIATLVLLLRSPPTPHVDVSAKIVSTETGEALLFEVPSAAEGSKIRFGGQEKPLTAGRASFALAADSLRVGDNLVLAEVVQPNAEIAPVRITLAVYYRIWVDTAALRAERSALDVVVTALPGTHVTLDGEELKLDDAGRGVRTYPIDVVGEAKSGVIEHVVRYRVQPPSGDTVVDELRTRIPVAMMQIDKPGREVITDKDSIEIAGAAGKDTQIRLDKTSIPVKDGRFLYRLPLPEAREYKPRLVASAAGKAPLGVTLSIRRVRDLNQAAAQFAAVQDLTYAKLSPNPAIYKGQKIELEGRVYAVDPRGADSVIQMFVRPCPSSRRCPLWVSDPHATDTNVDAWIKVLGVVQGEQQFRSEKNEIVTVPKVEAQFVLPAAP
jgi:hypothetical protein